jgi:hypothetical protein
MNNAFGILEAEFTKNAKISVGGNKQTKPAKKFALHPACIHDDCA